MPDKYIELGGPSVDENQAPYAVPGLVFWLDPERYNDLTAPWVLNGTKVASAPSRHERFVFSDTSKTARQTNDSLRPTLNLADAAFNGKNTISFTAASNTYIDTPVWSTPISHPVTTYVVASVNSFAVARTFIDATSSPTAVEFFTAVTSGITTMNSNGSQIANANGTLVAGTNYVLGATWSGAASSLYVSNASSAAYTGTLNSSTVRNIRIGASVFATLPMDGKIATVLVYQGAHDATQRGTVMKWLGLRYGITVGGL